MSVWIWLWFCIVYGGGRLAAATVGGWLLQMILCVAATATQLEMLSSLILGLHVMWKTPWACSTSSSDDRGFTCQLVFIILSRFVVYSLNSALAMLNISPSLFFFFQRLKKKNMAITFCFALSESYQSKMQIGVFFLLWFASEHTLQNMPKF